MSQGTVGQPHDTPELSLDEWFDMPEDQSGELVEGRLEEEEEPDYLHELLVALLVQILGNWTRWLPERWTVRSGDGQRCAGSAQVRLILFLDAASWRVVGTLVPSGLLTSSFPGFVRQETPLPLCPGPCLSFGVVLELKRSA